MVRTAAAEAGPYLEGVAYPQQRGQIVHVDARQPPRLVRARARARARAGVRVRARARVRARGGVRVRGRCPS